MPKPPQSLHLAAVLIARDEARGIARCLDSVRPWVDAVVVLDTGSTDDTVAIARRHGASVHHLDWPGDFSVARNRALDLADADWTLTIDADEWIASGGEGLRAWCEGPARLGVVCQVNDYDVVSDAGAGAGDGAGNGPAAAGRNWITRLLPRGVRYRGRVHEQAISDLPRERLDLHLGHDGYRDAQMAGKRDRNRPLLLLDLQDHPEDPYILFQLGKDAELREAFVEAGDWYARATAPTPPNANWRHELVVRRLHVLGQAGRLDEALALADEEMPAWDTSPDFFFVLGNLLLDQAMADPANAVDDWLPLATGAWDRCLAIGERPDLEGSVAGRGSHLAQHNIDVIGSQLALLSGQR